MSIFLGNEYGILGNTIFLFLDLLYMALQCFNFNTTIAYSIFDVKPNLNFRDKLHLLLFLLHCSLYIFTQPLNIPAPQLRWSSSLVGQRHATSATDSLLHTSLIFFNVGRHQCAMSTGLKAVVIEMILMKNYIYISVQVISLSKLRYFVFLRNLSIPSKLSIIGTKLLIKSLYHSLVIWP